MSDRIADAVERLQLGPDDIILEVGCGHGVAVDLICRRLMRGRVVAIDRSAKMIAAARRRNAAHIARGVVEFHVVDVLEFDPSRTRFDAVLALRVGLFHREPKRAHALIQPWLNPGARVVAEFDEP